VQAVDTVMKVGLNDQIASTSDNKNEDESNDDDNQDEDNLTDVKKEQPVNTLILAGRVIHNPFLLD
jgi:hypothetical protein